MRNWLLKLAAVLALFFPLAALAGGVPQLPSTSTYSEPSQIVGTLNALINQLNGLPSGSGGYAAQSNGAVSIGSFCQPASGATPLTCNGQRGIATFTGVTVAAVSTAAVVVNDSQVTANSACTAQIISDNSAAASFPYIRSVVPTAGVLTVNISNAAAATSTGASTFGIAFNCFQ
ncbi:MAG: hypothetical protein KGL35_24875 [Bradyrhizobium sp.]|nr:hypothetical protein [Bradyrhizobium sp.]